MQTNSELELAYKFVQYTNKNIFLTGKAGTGKTTFLKSLKNKIFKRSVVVAPTGVAAINAGGVTIHSFFQLAFGPALSERHTGKKAVNTEFKQKFNKTKINIIKTLDLLIIDEISMVRADVLDAIDEVLRRYKNRNLAFGGVQLLMIGDLQQLAPVVKDEEYRILSPYYKSMFFFNSIALKETGMHTVELKKVFRQQDDTFLNILNEIRNDKLSRNSYDLLHQRYKPDFKPKENDGYITLTTHNKSADTINESKLKDINKAVHEFEAIVKGTFSEYSFPTDYKLKLKEGAQVMYIKNDSDAEKRYFNGKIGVIKGFKDEFIIVKCEDDEEEIYTSQEKWENIKYTINSQTKEIEEEFIGSFTQYPLRLAWAITIHKSQGLTFEKAVIDSAAAFAHGQTYVALSRCKTLEGLILSSKISEDAIICSKEVNEFNNFIEENQPDNNKLNQAIYAYQTELIEELFNYKQLNFRFTRFEKTLRDNVGAYSGNIDDTVYEIQKNALPEIIKVATSFIKQVNLLKQNNPDIENNQALQERLKNAAEYFIKFHEEKIIQKLKESSFETDNRQIKKDVNESLSNVNEVLRIKHKTLQVCLHGFKTKEYLEAKAIATLDEKEITKKAKVQFKETAGKHSELYSQLKNWRRDLAEEKEFPHYMIASNKALHGIADELPATVKQLQSIPGIGKKKVEKFGKELLSMVLEYMQTKNIEPKEDSPEVKKPVKKKNHELSYEMYKEGKTIEEIAKTQGFVITTIENHLSKYIASGQLNINEFVENKTVEKITQYFNQHPEAKISEAKSALPESITYSQIRFIMSHLQFLKKS